jgi:DNA-binding transcriptional LysR family regulator
VVLERDEYVLLAAADSPLAEQPDPPSVDQLSRLPLILPAPARKHDPLAVRLRESLIDQPPWLRPRGTAAVQALVGAGLGAAIVPRLVVQLPALLPARMIALVKHREREYTASASGFVEIAEARFNPRSAASLADPES